MSALRLLLDASLSPETAAFLRSSDCDVQSLLEEGLGDLDDDAVAEIARKEKRVVVTFDLDFGEMYYFAARKAFSVIILRLNDQRVESVNESLQRFFEGYGRAMRNKKKNLFIVSEGEVRIADV